MIRLAAVILIGGVAGAAAGVVCAASKPGRGDPNAETRGRLRLAAARGTIAGVGPSGIAHAAGGALPTSGFILSVPGSDSSIALVTTQGAVLSIRTGPKGQGRGPSIAELRLTTAGEVSASETARDGSRRLLMTFDGQGGVPIARFFDPAAKGPPVWSAPPGVKKWIEILRPGSRPDAAAEPKGEVG